MKRALPLTLLSLLLVPAVQPAAAAHSAPFPHYHPSDRPPPARKRRRVVVRPKPKPRRVERRTVVVREKPVVVREREVTTVRRDEAEPEPAPERSDLLGLGVRLSGATVDGEKLGLSDAENPTMGGLGVQFRTRLSEHLGIEVAADFLRGSGPEFAQRTIPITGSLTWHLLPDKRIQPYALAGAGVQFTRLDYRDGLFTYNATEVVGQLGGGVEVFLTPQFSLQGDLRAQTIFDSVDDHAEVRSDCLSQVGEQTGFCDGLQAADPDDKLDLGLQFQVGATFYF
ncbi:MAG: outer membrane beta-barrel protein [Myxococcota bacterium]